MTRSMMQEKLNEEFIDHARASGLGSRTITRYALRNSLPPVVTVVGLTYSFLLGSAVLVETVFSWGGVGQYAVQAVLQSDYNAIQGFILVAAVFNLIVFLIVDMLYLVIDPRRS
jgi:ABC-type dipeptide/oligopeptide/nickel transport system permease component